MNERIFTQRDFTFSGLMVGDLVTEDVVNDLMDCLPPACMRSDCSQLGEPYSHREDPKTGKWRATYATFKRVRNGVWAYCGHCFRGENVERGEDPVYVGGSL